MSRFIAVLVALTVTSMSTYLSAADTEVVQKLQGEVELLQTKLQLAQKEIELLTAKLEKLSAENDQIKNAPVAAPRQAKLDQFSEGAIWKGEAKRAGHPDMMHWVLTVTERKGGAFKGEVVIRQTDGRIITSAVDGRAPTSDRGLVEFRTEKWAFGQLTLRGTLTDGHVGLVFVGTNPLGEPGAGAATLRRVTE